MEKFIFSLIIVLNFFAIIYMVFKEKRSANSIIAWTLFLYLTPVVGFILYILIGRKMGKTNMFIIKDLHYKLYKSYLKESRQQIEQKNANNSLKNYDMIRFLAGMDYAPYREDNQIDLFTDGNEFFNELLTCLDNAKKCINIEFYIFKNDDIGTKILKILDEKAKSGVEVRLLYDSVGSKSLNKRSLNDFIKHGGKVGEFFPSWLRIINLNMNFRNHRKIVVIDNEIGFIGGFNVGDEYLGKNPRFGYWRDTHIKFTGSSVKDLNLRFFSDWRYATKENVDYLYDLKNDSENLGNTGMQIVSSGPNITNKYEIKLGYLKMIQKAKKYIYIQSPYLIIDNSISDSLKMASLSGVDVKVMIPGKGDHPFVYWANLSYAGELLSSGVKVYHYDKNAFLHAKAVVIDDEICSTGTANMDTRSFELNFEVNAFIYSDKIAIKQRNAFNEDLLKSNELTLTEYKNRSNYSKVKEAFSKLFSSLL